MWKYVVGFSAILIGTALPAGAQQETVTPDTSTTTIEKETASDNETGQTIEEMGITQPADSVSDSDTSDSSWEFSGDFSNEEQSILYVTSNPSGAVVEVDDSVKGKTPVEITDLSAGKHVFKIMKSGYFLKKATVTLKENAQDTLEFDLVKPVAITLTSEPSEATVTIDGKDRGTTPVTYSKLKPGEHDITVSAEGYRSFDKRLSIPENDSLHVVLSPAEKASADTGEAAVAEKKAEGEGLSRSVLNKIALGAFAMFCAMIVVVELVTSD